jgi:hypothetical protein
MTNTLFEALELVDTPVIVKQEFRLYHDATGTILFYSMEDLPGEYIEITAEQFAAMRYDVYVKDGKVHQKKMVSLGKLVPSSKGFPTSPGDITLIEPTSTTYWENKTYEND